MFNSTHDALTFAYNFRGKPTRVLMEMPKEGGGLGGLDGAAQAGLIRAAVKDLGRLAEAVIVANYAPRRWACNCGASCCQKYRINFERQAAITEIARAVRGGKRLDQSIEMARKYFGEKARITDGRRKQDAYADYNAFKKVMRDVEKSALTRIDDVLRESGVVRD